MRGKFGAFVTDLWVADSQRGKGLGLSLLAKVRDDVSSRWGATFLRLNYYDENEQASGFYKRVGFKSKEHEIWVTLEGNELEALA
jgi:ribosomal protein S18 acetylase RimI-like enzyme